MHLNFKYYLLYDIKIEQRENVIYQFIFIIYEYTFNVRYFENYYKSVNYSNHMRKFTMFLIVNRLI